MTSEKRKRKVVEIPTQGDPPRLLQGRTPRLGAMVVLLESEGSAEQVRLLGRLHSPEVARQMIENIAGFFSQIAAWDAQQAQERKAA